MDGYDDAMANIGTIEGARDRAEAAAALVSLQFESVAALLAFGACTIAGVAADGPNVIGIPAGNISVPANGHITLRGRGEQWRVESKNF